MVETTINIEINIEYITISTKLVHNVFTFIIFKGGGGSIKCIILTIIRVLTKHYIKSSRLMTYTLDLKSPPPCGIGMYTVNLSTVNRKIPYNYLLGPPRLL